MGAQDGVHPIRYDGVLARSLPPLNRLRFASFPRPHARIWAVPNPRGATRGCRCSRSVVCAQPWERGRPRPPLHAPAPRDRSALGCPNSLGAGLHHGRMALGNGSLHPASILQEGRGLSGRQGLVCLVPKEHWRLGRVAQRLAQLPYTQLVGGSNPSSPTIRIPSPGSDVPSPSRNSTTQSAA